MSANRQVTYTLKLNSNISGILNQADKDAMRLDSSMWKLQKSLSAVGLGLGADFLINAVKDWTQGAADYEQAMLRIKNASENLGQGIKNELFINKEVDDFKLKLQETLDSYANFLFKIKQANLSGDQKNKVFDELNIIGKAAGLDQSKIDQITYQLSTQLGAGVIEGKQLRQLINLHPNYAPFIADELGLKDYTETTRSEQFKIKNIEHSTKTQQLFQALSNTQLTKSAIDAQSVLLPALEKYANTLRGNLPELLSSTQSELNDLSKTWDRFKNNLILGNKPELVNFLHEIKDVIGFISEHSEDVLKLGHALAVLGEGYLVYKLAGFGSSLIEKGNNFLFGSSNTEQAASKELATDSSIAYTESVIAETKANEDLIYESSSLEEHYKLQTELHSKNAQSIYEEKIELEKLRLSLEQVSIQTDLFTDAQEKGIANFTEYYIELDLVNKKFIEHEVALKGVGVQASLFTNSELEMSASVKTSTDAIALQNEELRLNSLLLGENKEAMINTSLASNQYYAEQNERLLNHELGLQSISGGNKNILNPYAGMFTSSNISSAVTSVFIAGMAVEVFDAFFPRGKLTKNGLEVSDWFDGAALVLNPGAWFDKGSKTWAGKGFDKVANIARENSETDRLQALFHSSATGVTSKLTANGEFLYSLIENSNLLDKLDPKDKYGKRITKNDQLYDKLSRNFDLSDYTFDENEKDKKIGSNVNLKDNTNRFGKDTSKIRGNSSNYFTINIHEMNGVKEFKVTTTKGDIDEKKVALIAGDTVLKMLVDAVNDSQHLRK